MHDRRIDGQAYLFGNAGGLYMRAMTWWDHQTQSIWSQPWGKAIHGELAGSRLELLPSQITTWSQWKGDHPGTLVMINDTSRLRPFRQGFSNDFVIGVVLSDLARAYPFELVREEGVINDTLGGFAILIWAGDQDFRAYSRQVSGETLTFRSSSDRMIDIETGSVWSPRLGLAIEGHFTGQALLPIPSLTSYDWAWRDFYPDSEIFDKK